MNIAYRIINQASKTPDKDAIRFPHRKGSQYYYDKLSFSELHSLSDHYAWTLKSKGIKKGDKVLLFVKQSLDFPTITFSLFKMGAVPVLIDPGMGKQNLLNAIKQVKPDAIIAEPIVFLLKLFKRTYFDSIKISITTSFFPGLDSLKNIKSQSHQSFKTEEVKANDMAAILFTSGGTGIPKGVVYTHHIFNKQTETLRDMFNLNETQIDIPGFPLFSFFTMAMGMTSCIPDMNPSKPAQCEPKALVQNIIDNEATFVAGSPAIWTRVGRYCVDNNIKLPSVKYVVMFGAPVRNEVHQMWKQILVNGNTYTPYGATECLPVANIDGSAILSETSSLSDEGHGTCIGYPAPNIEVSIIRCSDEVIEKIEDAEFLGTDEVGEIITKGPFVTPMYYDMESKTKEAKIHDGDEIWHRMGDLGRIDKQGRIWFYGRKTHRIEQDQANHYTVPCEAIFNKDQDIQKTALIQFNNRPALVIEENTEIIRNKNLKSKLLKMSKAYDHTKDIENFFLAKKFPVDVRHNIKIDRIKLSKDASSGKLVEIK